MELLHDAGVTRAELDQIRKLLVLAQARFGDSGRLRVYVYHDLESMVRAAIPVGEGTMEAARKRYADGSISAEASEGKIIIYMPNLRRMGTRSAVVFHEYFHTLEGAIFGSPLLSSPLDFGFDYPVVGPVWLVEGAAEYFGHKLADSEGLGSYKAARRSAVSVTRKSPSLTSYEKWVDVDAAKPEASVYSVGLLAAEFLATHYGVDQLQHTYWRTARANPRNWQKAFLDTFGITVEEFYRLFSEFRATL